MKVKKSVSMDIEHGLTISELTSFLSQIPDDAVIEINTQTYQSQFDSGSTTIEAQWTEEF